jgi:hypothetical protein
MGRFAKGRGANVMTLLDGASVGLLAAERPRTGAWVSVRRLSS